jgi:hypothetical protein
MPGIPGFPSFPSIPGFTGFPQLPPGQQVTGVGTGISGVLMVTVEQEQFARALAEAAANLAVAVQAIQQAIAAAQSMGATTVTLRVDLLQALALQLRLAADVILRALIRQQQLVNLMVGSAQVQALQQQALDTLQRASSSVDLLIQAIQMLTAAAAGMGTTTLSIQAAQALAVQLNAAVRALAEAAAAQRQVITATGTFM